ncbi:hypothetical protein EON83_30385 [bacterium]|nr:MAG: hypothetical protein EON83_30385 [bacterium]
MTTFFALAPLPEIFSAGTLIIDGRTVDMPQLPTVRQLVAERPQRARVFEKYGISYCCCSGNKSFMEVCIEQRLDPHQVLAELRASDATSRESRGAKCGDWAQMSSPELRQHIIEVHHAYLRSELPRLSYLIDRVATRHGSLYSELWELQGVFEEFKEEVEWHLEREEQNLFPLFERLEREGTDTDTDKQALQVAIGKEVCTLELEHAYICKTLLCLSSLTNGFRAPENACNTFRVMVDALEELANDMNIHLYEESVVLFGRIN